ncbi:hypothetical protein DFQ28_008033 [Apophysomyces sp. BC1034]|nr:hypothetical protein DFQ30_011216 [Apophysomyces sp. BC1015]KAG0182008.1 hypothetical protein DFQ29_006126 [Apophysomyces sp. BC1021]KAG0186318.1 hypothetical protein DFQ28_008033 [Apophysomyces sp. BC1034]
MATRTVSKLAAQPAVHSTLLTDDDMHINAVYDADFSFNLVRTLAAAPTNSPGLFLEPIIPPALPGLVPPAVLGLPLLGPPLLGIPLLMPILLPLLQDATEEAEETNDDLEAYDRQTLTYVPTQETPTPTTPAPAQQAETPFFAPFAPFVPFAPQQPDLIYLPQLTTAAPTPVLLPTNCHQMPGGTVVTCLANTPIPLVTVEDDRPTDRRDHRKSWRKWKKWRAEREEEEEKRAWKKWHGKGDRARGHQKDKDQWKDPSKFDYWPRWKKWSKWRAENDDHTYYNGDGDDEDDDDDDDNWEMLKVQLLKKTP